jgi:hypothetical protein
MAMMKKTGFLSAKDAKDYRVLNSLKNALLLNTHEWAVMY